MDGESLEMSRTLGFGRWSVVALLGLTLLALTACNLSRQGRAAQRVEITRARDTARVLASATPRTAPAQPTAEAPAAELAPTQRVDWPTPTAIALPSATPLPLRVSIDYPPPNTVVSGTTQILGSAIHPAFMHYQLEYSSQPNPQNIWYPITGARGYVVDQGVLGNWGTGTGLVADGLYQVRLRVLLSNGGELSAVAGNVQVRNQVISAPQPAAAAVEAPPVDATFSLDVERGFAPLTVQMRGPAGDAITRYSWNFGDGNTSTEANPRHTYTVPGQYTISLTAGGPRGSASYAQGIRVESRAAPVASFEAAPSAGEAPLSVQFSDRSSGNITSLRWDFGDAGAISSEREPEHTFRNAGTYNVALLVSGPGGESQAIRQIEVAARRVAAPEASFTMSPSQGQAPLVVQLNNTSSGEFDSIAWDFNGDGLTDSSESAPTTTYAVAGEYLVTVTVRGAGGESQSQQEVLVMEAPPVAAFTAAPLSGPAPLTVVFSNASSGADIGYVWDFDGDGAPDSTEASPSWTYEAAGQYSVSLVAAGAGGSATATETIDVAPPLLPPKAAFSAEPVAGAAPLLVNFINQSTGDVDAYEWDFQSDGLVDSTASAPTFTYDNAGIYTATLWAAGPGGTATFAVEISVREPPAQQVAPVSQIAFVTDRDGNNEIYLMDRDGGDVRNISSHPANDRHPSWSPDGQRIAFASRRDGDSFDIYVLVIDTGDVTRLTSQGSNTRPAWAPDGERIAFASDRFGDKDIMVMNADGGGQIQLTVDVTDDDQPTWSPDGRYIAYAAGAAGARDIYIIDASNGAAYARLTSEAGDNFLPAWLQDSESSWLAFTSTRAGNQDIYLVDPLTGEGLRQFTSAGSAERQPNWSSDGRTLLFVSDRADGGERNIYARPIDGGDLERLTPNGSNDREPKWR